MSRMPDLDPLIETTLEVCESPYIPLAHAKEFVLALRDRRMLITNAEGYIISTDYHDLQNDLILRYDRKLHEASQPSADLVNSAAAFMLDQIAGVETSGRPLQFKFFIARQPFPY